MYVIFDLSGKKIGSYEGELDETSNYRSHLLCPPNAVHALLPDGMKEDEVKLVDGVVVVDQSILDAKAAQAIAQAKAEAKQYLADTDWYVVREMEGGKPCPAEIKAKRIAARGV